MARRSRPKKPARVRRGDFGLSKIGASRFDYGDPYHLSVSVSWPAFVAALLAVWLAINLFFAGLYFTIPGGVANARPDSFWDVFFFSVETLATVGYGTMSPVSLPAHIISSVELVAGTAFTAIVTGLLFVRFSRPKAKILFADNVVVTPHNGHPTLMIRLVNGRMTPMTNADARLYVLIGERTREGQNFRRIQDMALAQSHLPLFIMPWTLMHRIDDASPLRGLDAETLPGSVVRLFLTIEARDAALATMVHDMKDYDRTHIRFGKRYASAVSLDELGRAIADLSRLSLLEDDDAGPEQPEGT
jgi:inward rectifier potassium channel